MQDFTALSQKIWGENASEVMDFMLNDYSFERESFRNEETMMNYIARILTRHCNKMIRKSAADSSFWEIRRMSIQIGVDPKRKARNILYIIRLLTGKLQPYPESPEPEYNFYQSEHLKDMEEEKFWEDLENQRESWIY